MTSRASRENQGTKYKVGNEEMKWRINVDQNYFFLEPQTTKE